MLSIYISNLKRLASLVFTLTQSPPTYLSIDSVLFSRGVHVPTHYSYLRIFLRESEMTTTTYSIAIIVGFIMIYLYPRVVQWLATLLRNHSVVVRHIANIEAALRLSMIDKLHTVDDVVIAVTRTTLSNTVRVILLDAEANQMTYREVTSVLNQYTGTSELWWVPIEQGIQLQTLVGEVDFVWLPNQSGDNHVHVQ